MGWYQKFYEREGPGIAKDAPKPRGLRALFRILADNWKALVQLNLIFLLYCLPVFTIGAALGALHSVTLMMARDEPGSAVSDFRAAFREQFKRYSCFGWIGVIGFVLSSAALCVYFTFSLQSRIYLPCFLFAIVVTLLFGLAWIFVLPLAELTDLRCAALLRNALLLGAGYVKYTFPTLLCEAVLVFGTLLFLPILWIPLLTFTCSLLSLLNSFTAWAGIQKYICLKPETKMTERTGV